jgi:hypothetical protein
VERLRRWKGRAPENPLPILIEGSEALVRLGVELSPIPRRLAEAFWPGPLTLVLYCPEPFAPGVAREDGAVGFRCSSHPVAAALARRVARAGVGPLTATSLNRSGEAPARPARRRPLLRRRAGFRSLIDVPARSGWLHAEQCRRCPAPSRDASRGAISSAQVKAALEENRLA